MTATLTGPRIVGATDTRGIHDLDFDPALPCEHPAHEHAGTGHCGPAWALVSSVCPGCGDPARFLLCESAWIAAGRHDMGLTCAECGTWCLRDQAWTVVRLVAS